MILLLDEDDEFRSGLAECFEEDGYRVCGFPSPRSLPDLGSLREVRAAVADYNMSGENGLAFADRLNRLRPDIPIVLTSAYPEPLLDAATQRRSFLSLLRKPFSYEDLLDLLRLEKSPSTPPGLLPGPR